MASKSNTSVGIDVTVQGERAFRASLSEINAALRVNNAEIEAVSEAYKGNEKSIDALTAKQDALDRSILTQKERLEALESALKKTGEKYGETDTRTLRLRESLIKAQTQLEKTKRELNDTSEELDKAKENTGNLSVSLSDLADKAGINLPPALQTLTENMDGATAAGAALVGVLAGIVTGLAKATISTAENAKQLKTMSQETGLTVEQLQELQYTSAALGIEEDEVQDKMKDLVSAMRDARDGSEDMQGAFKRLGVEVTDRSGELKSAGDVFFEVVDALGSVQNATERDALAMQIFGEEAQKLNPLIDAGKETLQRYSEEANKLGYVMDKPITFTWSYSQDVNEPQSHYSIQQQTSSGWQNLIPKTAGTAHTATVPAGTFTAGQAAWRVMVWSQNGTVASQWSDPAYIIVQSQPKAPNITSAGTSPSPTFAWQAAQQQGYEIILGDYQAGVKYGTEKTWTYPGTLQNGNVTFQIRVQNAQGIWSPWAGVETYISNIPQGTISLSGSVKDQAVSLSWTSSGLIASQYNVLRDGKVIATTQSTAFTDYYSAGKCAYQVYAMLSGGYYTPSNVLTEIVKPKYAMISLASSISWIPLRIKSGGLPTYGSEMQAQAAFVHYQGRELPVAYTTEFLDKSYTYSFSFLRKEDMQAFAKLCGQMVILKTPQGERSIGILTGISATRQNRINDFSFSITEIDFSEVELNA